MFYLGDSPLLKVLKLQRFGAIPPVFPEIYSLWGSEGCPVDRVDINVIRLICGIIEKLFIGLLFTVLCYLLFFIFWLQVQNLNNIMAFPLENVMKSELRESRLVSPRFNH